MRRRSSCGGASGDGAGVVPVIGKVIRGKDVRRLLYYLFGPGRANEHTDPRLVAGFGDPAELEPERRPDGTRDVRRLAGLLEQPLAALRGPGYDKPVWHCAVRAAPQPPPHRPTPHPDRPSRPRPRPAAPASPTCPGSSSSPSPGGPGPRAAAPTAAPWPQPALLRWSIADGRRLVR
jgi:hypothetical protein